MPKIISERCELVTLCYINPSGPGFFRHSVVSMIKSHAQGQTARKTA